jgi:hypothetical protein
MIRMRRSKLFMQQWKNYARAYRDRAGINIAERFIVAVDEALRFIHRSPYACSIYDPGEEYGDLQAYQFRKRNLHDFPHAILFRVGDDATIFVEVIYAHKMNMSARLAADTTDDHAP